MHISKKTLKETTIKQLNNTIVAQLAVYYSVSDLVVNAWIRDYPNCNKLNTPEALHIIASGLNTSINNITENVYHINEESREN